MSKTDLLDKKFGLLDLKKLHNTWNPKRYIAQRKSNKLNRINLISVPKICLAGKLSFQNNVNDVRAQKVTERMPATYNE